MTICRCAVALALACAVNACTSDTAATGLLPAQGSGWERVGFLTSLHPADVTTRLIGITSYGGDLTMIDPATGDTRWRLQLPATASEYFVASWVGPRHVFAFNPFPGGSPTRFLIDAATGTVRRSGPALIHPMAMLDTWALAVATDSALLGLRSLADSVIWRRTYPRITCGRTYPCRRFTPLGAIRDTLYLYQSVLIGPSGATVDSLLRIEADGRVTARPLPFVNESASPGRQPAISAGESLFWTASENSVYGVSLSDGMLRWRVLTSTLMPPRAGVSVTFSSAEEDPVERTLRVAFFVEDNAKNRLTVEGVVLRTSDGSVVRRISLDATMRGQLVYVGPCGTDGVAFLNSEGTIDYARWENGRVSRWRSSRFNDALPAYLQQSSLPFIRPAGTSTLIVELGLTNTMLGLNCAQ